jgi:3-oxoacyl-[acyl-carrier protein] reductase
VGNLPYGASKGALDRIVLGAARELAYLGVTSNVLNPGPTDTGWMTEVLKSQIVAARRSAGWARQEMCSQEGGWVNGQLLVSDGGASAG